MKYLIIFVLAITGFMGYELYISASRPARMIRRIREERLKNPEMNWPEVVK
jgi:hypothetical protein